ncbi:MAG: hypothetical protein JSV23_09275 [Promethearchaeota archaeon]|nr:MAG: hypothetical protein JSV23_09275 [Candidatus Lokiarchaeota archaeon]
MSKIPKQPKKEQKIKKRYRTDENFAYRSVIISAILGGIFYLISLLLNFGIITNFIDQGVIWDFIDVLFKVLAILLFFLFMITSLGNYKELIGKPVNWKELLLILGFSIGQTILNIWVFIFTLFGLLIILIYLYLAQGI